MILRRVHPEPSVSIETTEAGARDRLRELYAPPTADWLRLNLIASVDGNASGADGTSESLSNRADRAILGAIRSLSDVVLVGAQTLRVEGYLVPKTTRLAVLTRGGDFSGAALRSGDDAAEILVLGPETARATAISTLPGIGVEFVPLTEDPDATSAVAALRVGGLRSIVCEGGPRLAAQLLAADAVDELCLSTSPRISATGLPVLGDGGAPAELRLTQLLLDETGGSYARWSRRASQSESARDHRSGS